MFTTLPRSRALTAALVVGLLVTLAGAAEGRGAAPSNHVSESDRRGDLWVFVVDRGNASADILETSYFVSAAAEPGRQQLTLSVTTQGYREARDLRRRKIVTTFRADRSYYRVVWTHRAFRMQRRVQNREWVPVPLPAGASYGVSQADIHTFEVRLPAEMFEGTILLRVSTSIAYFSQAIGRRGATLSASDRSGLTGQGLAV